MGAEILPKIIQNSTDKRFLICGAKNAAGTDKFACFRKGTVSLDENGYLRRRPENVTGAAYKITKTEGRLLKSYKNTRILDWRTHSPLPKNRASKATFAATFSKFDSYAGPEGDFFVLPARILRGFGHVCDTPSEKRKKQPKKTPREGTHVPAQRAKARQN